MQTMAAAMTAAAPAKSEVGVTCSPSCVVPTAPLAAGATYRARLELSVNGSNVVEEWEFETER